MEQVVERIRLLHKHGLLVVRSVAAGESPPRRLHAGVRDEALSCSVTPASSSTGARTRRMVGPLLRHLATLDPFG